MSQQLKPTYSVACAPQLESMHLNEKSCVMPRRSCMWQLRPNVAKQINLKKKEKKLREEDLKKKKEQCENNLAKRSPIVSEFKACQARLLVLSSLYVKLLYIINT